MGDIEMNENDGNRTYTVRVVVTSSQDVDVEAADENEAVNLAKMMMSNGDIDVAGMSVDGAEFDVIA